MTNTIRSLSLADRIEIQDLISQANYYVDSGQVDAWVGTFTIDGRLEKSPELFYAGHDVLRRFLLKREERPGIRDYVHWASNIIITPTESGARAQTYIMLVKQTSDGLHVSSPSMKIDELQQENGKWRFKVRRSARWPMGNKGAKEDS